MQRHRVLVVFGIAWLSALALSWWVYRTTAAPQSREVVQAVAAARDLPAGKRITSADLKFVTVDRKDSPKGAFFKFPDVVGFIQTGFRVEVLYTRSFSNGDAATTTVLQNVKVIAYGRQLEPQLMQPKADPREAAKVTVATLLVTQEDAEKLALAEQRGRIQLVLRNPLDEEIFDESSPVSSADLGIEEPRKEPPVRIEAPTRALPPPLPPKPPSTPTGAVEQRVTPDNDGHIVIRVYRGNKVSEDIFE